MAVFWFTQFRPEDEDISALRLKLAAEGFAFHGYTFFWIHPQSSLSFAQRPSVRGSVSVSLLAKRPNLQSSRLRKMLHLLVLIVESTTRSFQAVLSSKKNSIIFTYPDTWSIVPVFFLSLIRPKQVLFDLHDPLLHQAIHPRSTVTTAVLKLLLKVVAARGVQFLVASPGIQDFLPKSANSEVVYFGFSCSDSKHLQAGPVQPQDNKLRILYGGTFYGSRSPRIFLEALLSCQNAELRKDIEIELYGKFSSLKEESACKALIAELGFPETSLAPLIPRYRFLARAKDWATHLLMITHASESGYAIPGKLFDYIALGKPIFAITQDQLLLDTMRRNEVDFISADHEQTSILNSLQICLKGHATPKPTQKQDFHPLSCIQSAKQIIRLTH